MGNRAVITNDMNGTGIYLHWNGGRDSVEAFLKYCELRGFRADDYGLARLAQVIGNFFGGGLSIGIGPTKSLDTDNGDNGTYIIKGWKIIGRKFFEGTEQNEYDINEMLQSIDEAQPKSEQLGKFLKGKEIKLEDLKIGDKVVYIDNLEGKSHVATVRGIGEDRFVNGHEVKGIPYMDAYGKDDPASNCNNYLDTVTFRLYEEDKTPATAEMFINEELKGIELKFNKMPTREVRDELKAKGFKWHVKKALWYAKSNPERLELAKKIAKEFIK